MTHRSLGHDCPPSETARLHSQLVARVEDVASWTEANRRQLNAAKTEVLWCSSRRQMHQLPIQPLTACGSCVSPASLVRDLGVCIDSGLTMSPHVHCKMSRTPDASRTRLQTRPRRVRCSIAEHWCSRVRAKYTRTRPMTRLCVQYLTILAK
jgi:hypothetical protein